MALTAGTTTIQGINAYGHEQDGFAHQGVVINNAERFPSRAYSVVFPLAQSAAYWEQKKAEYWERFLIPSQQVGKMLTKLILSLKPPDPEPQTRNRSA